MAIGDQFAEDLRFAERKFQQPGHATRALPPRGRHRVKGVGDMPHAVPETLARFHIRRVAVPAAHNDILRAQPIDELKSARQFRSERHHFDHVGVVQ